MNPHRSQQVEELYHAVLEREPRERAAILALPPPALPPSADRGQDRLARVPDLACRLVLLRSSLQVASAACVVWLLAAPGVLAQVTTADIIGRVTDGTGAVVPGAKVRREPGYA